MGWNSSINKEYWIDFASGWLSGGVAVLVCQPLDTVLVRYQAGRSLVTGSLSDTRWLLHQFGLSSLWRGSSCMIGAVPFQNALLMGGYGLGKRLVVDNQNDNDNYWMKYNAIFGGGCVGGILQSFLMSPVELWKVSQQTQLTTTTNTTMTTTTTMGQPWWRVLWGGRGSLSSSWQRGLGATLWRDGIPHGIWFVSYECAKDHLQQTLSPSHYEYTVPLISGAIAAIVAWVSKKEKRTRASPKLCMSLTHMCLCVLLLVMLFVADCGISI